jgi:radical SAM superfamily enzyme YgiQ (UPF0313 family)
MPTENLHVNAPLGLMYLASAARAWVDEPLDIRLVDMRIGGLGVEDMAAVFRDFDPHVAAMSTFTYEAPMMHALARAFKTIRPGVRIIAGGPHPTIMPDDVAMNRDIDFAVMGEGEKTFCGLLSALFSGRHPGDLPGIAYLDKGRVRRNPPAPPIEDLDAIPFPAWDLVRPGDYTSKQVRNMNWIVLRREALPIFTSRGCPYRCVYCHPVFGKTFRTRSPENVLEEVRFLHREHGLRELHIIDDVFNFDRERALDIMGRLEESALDLKIAFPNGLRADRMDAGAVEAYRRAGTYMMIFAVETASPRLQKFLKKTLDLNQTRRAIENADRAGLFVKGFFMLGFPTETPEEMKATLDFAASTRLHVASFFQVVPFPGTELFEMARKDFPDIEKVYQDLKYYGERSFYEMAYGPRLSAVQRSAYRMFYFSPRRLWRIFRRIPSKRFLLSGFFFFLSYASRLPLPWNRRKEAPMPGQVSCGTG